MKLKHKTLCDNCRNPCRNVYYYKEDLLCYRCYVKKRKILGYYSPELRLKRALQRVYVIRRKRNVKKIKGSIIDIPAILIGKKVKFVLCE